MFLFKKSAELVVSGPCLWLILNESLSEAGLFSTLGIYFWSKRLEVKNGYCVIADLKRVVYMNIESPNHWCIKITISPVLAKSEGADILNYIHGLLLR